MNFVVDQLHHVFVAGDDVDGMRSIRGFAGERADQVVGLEAGEFENRDAIGLERAADVRKLLRQVLWHGGAVGFVAFIFHLGECLRLDVELADAGDGLGLLVAERGGGHVVNRGQILGRKVIAQFAQHVDENIDRGGRQSALRRHGPLARHGMVRAENERHGVDQEDAPVRGGRRRGGRCNGIWFRRFPARRQVVSLPAGAFTVTSTPSP